jgi:molybdopterin-containing oxidoreductase family iron-sulfur binding subunit
MQKISRRRFLYSAGIMGTVMGGGGEEIVNRLTSYANPPLPVRPGMWSTYATVCRECPAGCGLHLRFCDGRVTKAEGNPLHPVNRGALCSRGQSSVQGVYDPDRLKSPSWRPSGSAGQVSISWDEAFGRLGGILGKAAKVHVISDLQTGTLAAIMQGFCGTFKADPPFYYEPLGCDALRTAHDRLFGLDAVPAFRLDRCDFIMSFSADFLDTWISPVEFARGFSSMHGFKGGSMGRMAYAGPGGSLTAANADDFFPVPPGSERFIALAMVDTMIRNGWIRAEAEGVRAVAAKLGSTGAIGAVPGGIPIEPLARRFFDAKESVALAGPAGAVSPMAQDTAMAAALLNVAAGRIGSTVDFSSPHALTNAGTAAALESLIDRVAPDDAVVLHNCNLAYTHRRAMQALRRARTVICLSTLPDETAAIADWVLPLDAPPESWGDYEPCRGVQGLMQPAMKRLYDTRAAGDILLSLARAAGRPIGEGDFRLAVRKNWESMHAAAGNAVPFDRFWEAALRTGGRWTAPLPVKVSLDRARVQPFAAADAPAAGAIALSLGPSIALYDGRLANRGWLQESPHPLSGAMWGGFVDIHPDTARSLAIHEGAIVEIRSTAGSCRMPAHLTRDVAENSAVIAPGGGHSARGLTVAAFVGGNAFDLFDRTENGALFAYAKLHGAGLTEKTVSREAVNDQFGRGIVQTIGLQALRTMRSAEAVGDTLPGDGNDHRPDRFAPRHPPAHRWGMVADLHRCIGCGACAVACYAENNIPVVGRKEVDNGREMAWLKVAPYRTGNAHRVGWLPLFCQQCDAAPCESVCPVFASYHNEEGLNGQIYNRCIGTRYCSNNCPYKVRRFNWKNTEWKPPLDKQLNPEVTVRCRGVMEKCTFCIQRIVGAEYRAKLDGRPLRDGEIQPACVQTCPARALAFGDLLDRASVVSRLANEDPRRYRLLEELNTRPAVTFLRRIIRDDPL